MSEDYEEQEADAPEDGWEEFRYDDGDPIGLQQLARLNLAEMPDDVAVSGMDDYFPETTIRRLSILSRLMSTSTVLGHL